MLQSEFAGNIQGRLVPRNYVLPVRLAWSSHLAGIMDTARQSNQPLAGSHPAADMRGQNERERLLTRDHFVIFRWEWFEITEGRIIRYYISSEK